VSKIFPLASNAAALGTSQPRVSASQGVDADKETQVDASATAWRDTPASRSGLVDGHN
jgi:hypothetical protein